MSRFMKTVVHGSAWLFIANFVTKTLNIFLTLVLIRGLGVDHYGFLVTVWGAGMLLAGGLDLGMSQALQREGARDNQLVGNFVKHIIMVRTPLTLVALFIVVVIGGNFIEYTYPEIYFSSTVLLILTALVPIIDSWHFPFAFVCHIFDRFLLIAIYRCAYFAATLLIVSLLVYVFHSIEIVALSYSLITIVAVVLFYKNVSRLIPKHVSSALPLQSAVKQGSPFFAINVLSLAYLKIELLILSAMLSTFEAGVYSAQYQVILLCFVVPSLVYNTLMPNLYKNSKDTLVLRDTYSKLCRYLNLFALFLMPLVIYFADVLIIAIGGEALKGQSSGLRILAFMLLFMFTTASLNFLNVLDLLKKRILYEATGLILLTLSIIFVIPTYKVNGVAVMAVLSYGITSILAFQCLYKMGIVDFKRVLRDFFKIVPAIGLSSLTFFYGTPMLWLNGIIYTILTVVLLSVFKFWEQIDRQVFAHSMDFFKK